MMVGIQHALIVMLIYTTIFNEIFCIPTLWFTTITNLPPGHRYVFFLKNWLCEYNNNMEFYFTKCKIHCSGLNLYVPVHTVFDLISEHALISGHPFFSLEPVKKKSLYSHASL